MAARPALRLTAYGVIGLVSIPAWGYGSGIRHGGGMMSGAWSGGMPGWVIPILVLLVLVVAVVGALRWVYSPGRRSSSNSRVSRKAALAILEERFAHGQIDKEEFEERRKLLFK